MYLARISKLLLSLNIPDIFSNIKAETFIPQVLHSSGNICKMHGNTSFERLFKAVITLKGVLFEIVTMIRKINSITLSQLRNYISTIIFWNSNISKPFTRDIYTWTR